MEAVQLAHMLFARDGTPASQLSPDQREQGCVAYDPATSPPYHYDPSLAAGLVFSICFLLITVAHYGQAIWSRKWFYLTLGLGATGELMGWVARAVGHYCPYNHIAFAMQISVLILAPCFWSAAIYYILGELIKTWGDRHSPIGHKWYLIIFVTGDVISIAVQALGGGLASSEADDNESTAKGSHIMLAGIVLQLISMGIFVVFWVIVIYRARLEPSFHSLRTIIYATSASTILIVVRNAYRCVELAMGWDGTLMTHEVYFDVLDASLMVLCGATLNIFHPAWHIPRDYNAEPTKSIDSSSSLEMGEREGISGPVQSSNTPFT